jgi:hypothetical protein
LTRPLPSLVAIGAALLTQIICVRLTGAPLDLRSPLITGLSLSLLLRADALWLYATAGVIAIASKFLLRAGGKHIFNPAGFAIVLLLLASGGVWISPGQWGAAGRAFGDPGAVSRAARRHRDLLLSQPC